MKPNTSLLLAFAGCWLLSFASARADTIVQGPISFSSTNPASYQQFSSSSGYLDSVTILLTNFSVTQDIIWDNDSTGAVSFTQLLTQQWLPGMPVPQGHGALFEAAFEIATNMPVELAYPDDGDGVGYRNAGPDEITWSIVHSNLFGSVTKTDAFILAGNTGVTNLVLLLPSHWYYSVSVPLSAEVYFTNQVYSGDLYVTYEYGDQCMTPEFQNPVFSNGTIVLDIGNFSIGSTNRIQRCLDLQSNAWTDVATFVSSDWLTNWTEQISNDWGSAFYRVISK